MKYLNGILIEDYQYIGGIFLNGNFTWTTSNTSTYIGTITFGNTTSSTSNTIMIEKEELNETNKE